MTSKKKEKRGIFGEKLDKGYQSREPISDFHKNFNGLNGPADKSNNNVDRGQVKNNNFISDDHQASNFEKSDEGDANYSSEEQKYMDTDEFYQCDQDGDNNQLQEEDQEMASQSQNARDSRKNENSRNRKIEKDPPTQEASESKHAFDGKPNSKMILMQKRQTGNKFVVRTNLLSKTFPFLNFLSPCRPRAVPLSRGPHLA